MSVTSIAFFAIFTIIYFTEIKTNKSTLLVPFFVIDRFLGFYADSSDLILYFCENFQIIKLINMKVALSGLDKLVKEGKILEAFDTYFTDGVVTYDEAGNKTTSKAEKRALLEGFFNEFTRAEEISLFDSFIDGDTSYSSFRFIFSKNSGEKFQWDEVIIRKWKDNLVVSEFYSNQDYAELKKSLVKDEPKKKATAPKKAAAPAAEKKAAAPKAEKAAPKAEKAPKAETAPKAKAATVKKAAAPKAAAKAK